MSMPFHVLTAIQDGQALVRYGETGTKFFVIRYGKVRVMRPQPGAASVEVIVLKRGQFVGERTLITGWISSDAGSQQTSRSSIGV